MLSLDYVSGWFMKGSDYMAQTLAEVAFVTTNSICQGIQVSALWPTIMSSGTAIRFAYQSFKWSNLASHNAGVTVSIIGLTKAQNGIRKIFSVDAEDKITIREATNINAYLVPGDNVFVAPKTRGTDGLGQMQFGNHPYYANALMLRSDEAEALLRSDPRVEPFLRPLYGSQEFISGNPRYCLWINDTMLQQAESIQSIAIRLEAVKKVRAEKEKDLQAKKLLSTPYRFRDQYTATELLTVVPIVSSENREYLPVGIIAPQAVVHNKAFALYDAPLWNMALIASRLHLVWIGTVCGKLETRYRYSNTLGWNTFPVPPLTEQNKADLTRCAEDILLAREAHFPATIADLYDPETMPANLRAAHERNDETLERIYLGRRFKNDTERLETLFALYTRMTAKGSATTATKPAKGKKA
jgi:hypothetical protein